MSGVAEQTVSIALIGNPNTGKTTLFNALTGMRQRVGNYPGVTVEKKIGELRLDGQNATLLDLPGTYSLAASSPDERVVVDVLAGNIGLPERPDMIVCVVDSTNLMRNLFLASQVAELGIPMVIALNQFDLARRRGIMINVEELSKRLGVPVIPTVAARREGVPELLLAIEQTLKTPRYAKVIAWPEAIERATQTLRAILGTKHGQNVSDVELRRILFDADSAVAERYDWGNDDRKSVVGHARKIISDSGLNPHSAEAVLHYRHLNQLLEGVICHGQDCINSRSESIDRLLTHRVWGLIIFAGMMWFVFQSVYSWAGPLMDVIEVATGWAQGLAAGLLEGMPMLQSLVTDGIIGGVGGVVVFLPQILILFFFIGLLEDTGYMPRAAFLMDKAFGWCGLNGKSFVPLLSSYACAIPGVMATRTIQDPKARLTTVLIAPLMSCSARLPVYVLFIGAFIEPVYGSFIAGLSLFLMHFVGLFIAMPIAWFFTRFIVRTNPQPFLLEMCAYRVPNAKNLFRRIWDNGKEFLIRAGTIIVAFSIIIWALLYFPRPENLDASTREQFVSEVAQESNLSRTAVETELAQEDSELSQLLNKRINASYIEQSYMGRIGKTLQPIFEYAGFDWKITVGVVASFPAREVIIATMGIIYSLGEDVDEESDTLRERMHKETWPAGTERAGQPVYTIPVCFAIMVFFALCMQCGATVAVIARETSWGWAAFTFTYMTILAWLGAVISYQIGTYLL